MKVVVSLPEPLCADADRLARVLGVSRNRLYSNAIAEYLELRCGAAITDRLNPVYADQGSALSDELARAQSSSLSDEA